MSLIKTRRRQLAWAAFSALSVGGLVLIDRLTREGDGRSLIAPTAGLLWTSIGLGAGLGAVALAATWLAPSGQRAFAAEFARLPLRERARWKHQRRNLRYHGWFLIAGGALAVWCAYWWVFMLPAVYAMNAVLFAGLPRWVIPASAPLEQQLAEPGAAPGGCNVRDS